jgi:hypothetical protein
MGRELLSVNVTKVYDKDGRHIGNLEDRYFVDRRPGREGQQVAMQGQTQQSKPTPQTPPPPERPLAAIRTQTAADKRRIALKALTLDVPEPPSTHTIDEAIRAQQAQQRC